MATKNNKKGFTLVELIVVIAIIGILSAVIVPSYNNIVENARLTADKKEATEIVRAIEYANIMGPIKIGDEIGATINVTIEKHRLNIYLSPTDYTYSFEQMINAIYKAKNNHELDGNVKINDASTVLYYKNQSKKYISYDFSTGVYAVESFS